MSRPWADLPQELLSAVADALTLNPNPNHNRNPLDILAFRSVCKSWRSSCPPNSSPSLLSPVLPVTTSRPFPPVYNRSCNSPHSSIGSTLSVTVIYSLRRPSDSPLLPKNNNTWLLFVDEYNSGMLKIRTPFSRCCYSVPIFFPMNVNLFDFNVNEISRFYNLSYRYYYDDKQDVKLIKPLFRSEDVLKVVLFPDGSGAVALYDGGKLGFIRLDVEIIEVCMRRKSMSQWGVLHGGKGFRFDDIVDYKGRVLGVDREGRVYEIGHFSSKIKPVVRSSCISGEGGRRKRLVESLGLLYLIVRCDVTRETNRTTVAFKVYELNIEKKKWVEINSIGDRVFFFGLEFSFSASAQDVSCGKNCILFTKRSFKSYSGDKIDDVEVSSHSESNGVYIEVCHLGDVYNVGAIESYCGYSDTFWPPPAWIWPIDRLQRLMRVDAAIDEIMKIFEKFKAKFPELTVEGTSISHDDLQQHVVDFQIWRDVQHLKNMLNQCKEREQKLMSWESNLHNGLSINGHKRSLINMSNQMNRSLVLAQAASPGTEERSDSLNETQSATESCNIDHCLLNEVADMLVKQNSIVFQIEECASDLVCQYYSRQY